MHLINCPHPLLIAGGINAIFLAYSAQVVAPLAAKYGPLSFQFVSVWGALQVSTQRVHTRLAGGASCRWLPVQEAGGPALTPPPYPNVAYPSPYKYMNDGCIHCSTDGWDILMGRLYDGWLAGRL